MATSRIADSVGRVLGDRYRLTRPLGVGASAHVYVAEDVRLRRQVAIKLLHPGLAGDEAFGRRFRAEAQVVAALRHPNILRVYDWGEDDGTPYLVMELLAGGSLRSLLDRGHLLSPAQAASVGADAARALDYAHRRGLVHRDIKPANLIFDDEGRLTVADFGLARALAEAAWTEPAGAVVGTARYAAPEQVRGETLDSRADVYSLSLVLVEATTGAVPFAADTTLGTLMARLERPLVVDETAGPLGPVMEAAGTISPADRLDAAGLAQALDGVAARLPPPAPLPLVSPVSGGDAELDPSPTDYPGRPRLFDGAIDNPPRREERTTPAAPPGRPRRRVRRWVIVFLALALLAGGGTAAALVATKALTPSHPVPNLVHDSQATAVAALRPLHLHLRVGQQVYDATDAVGTIISQRPATGRLKEGDSISVIVSLGPAPVPVPSVVGTPASSAKAVLANLGLKWTTTSQTSLTVAAGNVISASPDSGTLVPGQAVALVVSIGKPTVVVPELTVAQKSSFTAAQAALASINLVATETTDWSDTVPKGQVIATLPSVGTSVPYGSAVTVTISKGPHLVAIPKLHSSVGAENQALTSLGFVVSGVTGSPIGTVVATSPSPGTLAHYGSSVQIITG